MQTRRYLSLTVLAAGAALVLAACQTATTASRPGAAAQSVSDSRSGEAVQYASSNIDFFRDAFAGKLDDNPITLEGRLTLPEGDGPFPVVVWQHGSGPPYHKDYAEFRAGLRDGLAAERIGLFIADSYTARAIKETATDQGRLSSASRVTDALRAMDALSRHPRIDPARIGISGRSYGGVVAIRTSHEPYSAVVVPGRARYAAHVAFYPGCPSDFERYEPTGAPVLVLLGEADDYTDHGPCLKQADRMRKAGGSVETVVYPEAHHGFIGSKAVHWDKKAWQFNNCPTGVQRQDGEVEYPGIGSSEGITGREFVRRVVKSGCVKRGAHIGRNDAAAEDSLKRTVAFFATHLKK